MRRFPEGGGGARPSVCIVTSELIGPFNNGGIGTSMTGLARCLADAGFPVTILYTGGKLSPPSELARWRSRYAGAGIGLDWIRHGAAAALAGPVAACGFVAPWLIHAWLADRKFDIVQFNDCMGEGLYCLAARRLGLAFRDTAMFVGLHSPSQWIFEINRMLPTPPLFAAFNHAERLTARTADLLWSPSRYLAGWAAERGFALPEATFLQRYVLPPVPLFGGSGTAPPARQPGRMVPKEIVFFGRLEERKGLRLFCDALRRIEALLVEKEIAVTFLGKPGTVGDGSALDFLEEEGRGRRFAWTLETGLGQPEALAYLRGREALAVMASPADNSPCTVYEALSLAIPFLAARTGGIPELIAEEQGEAILFDYDADALAARLEAAIRDGVAAPAAAEAQDETARRWIGGFEACRALVAPPPAPGPRRKLLALVDGSKDADLPATLASLAGEPFDTVALIDRGWEQASDALLRVPADRPDALLDLLSSHSDHAVLLVRAGVALEPGAGPRLAEALRAPEPAGIIPAVAIAGRERSQILVPLGGSPSFCLYEGAAPGGLVALKAERLTEAAGGRRLAPDAEHLGLADLAVAAGLEIWPLPEVLASHRGGLVGESGNRRAPERVAAYAATPSATERYYIAAIGAGRADPGPAVSARLRSLRDWMATRGLGWAVRAAWRIVPRTIVRRLRG
jgi:glycosyltransferase involved in cell wall biosynthesis